MATDLDRAPSDDELDEWINEHGCTDAAFVRECEREMDDLIADGELRAPAATLVPYGSTMVALPDEVEMPEKVLRSVAFRWWEDERISFVSGTDGARWLESNDEGGE